MSIEQSIILVLERSIQLYKTLVEMIRQEGDLAERLGNEEHQALLKRRNAVEEELAVLNEVVTEVFDRFAAGTLQVDPGDREEISTLVARLRESMKKTLDAVRETTREIDRERSNIIDGINSIDRRRKAMSAYRNAC